MANADATVMVRIEEHVEVGLHPVVELARDVYGQGVAGGLDDTPTVQAAGVVLRIAFALYGEGVIQALRRGRGRQG